MTTINRLDPHPIAEDEVILKRDSAYYIHIAEEALSEGLTDVAAVYAQLATAMATRELVAATRDAARREKGAFGL